MCLVKTKSIGNQSIFVYLMDDITAGINTIWIYIASLECSKAKYPEWPAANDLFIEHIYIYRAYIIKI